MTHTFVDSAPPATPENAPRGANDSAPRGAKGQPGQRTPAGPTLVRGDADTIPDGALSEPPTHGQGAAHGGGGPRVPGRRDQMHIWELQAFRDLVAIAGAVVALWLLYALRSVTLPALVAVVLAYGVDPAVSAVHRRFGMPRSVSTALGIVVVVGALVAGAAFVAPRVVTDLENLLAHVPAYLDQVRLWLGSSRWLGPPLLAALDGTSVPDAQTILDGAGNLFGTFAAVMGLATYSLIAWGYTLLLFVYFSIRFPVLPRLLHLLPANRRPGVLLMLGRFARACGAFLRGQLVVAMFTTLIFAVGFSLVGVPHALLAAAVGGMLSFIPNGQASGLVLAWLFGVLQAGPDLSVLRVFGYPALVFVVSQSLETFLVTPLVQGSQTRLHPLLVLGALIAGGSVGGVVGIFVAIPIAACGRIFAREVVVPSLRRYAARV